MPLFDSTPDGVSYHYFKNCRGFNYLHVPVAEYEKSGWIVRSRALYPTADVFNGANKIGAWTYFDPASCEQQFAIMRGQGINCIRVFLDIYAWSVIGRETFLQRARQLAKLAAKYKIYIMWVVFDGVNTNADEDPTTHEAAYLSGLQTWRRAPIYIHRDLNFMDASGTQYVTDCVSALSSCQATLLWDVMNESGITSGNADAPPSAVDFIVSACSLVKNLVPDRQPVTIGHASINNFVLTSVDFTGKDNRLASWDPVVSATSASIDVMGFHPYCVTNADRLRRTRVAQHAASSLYNKPTLMSEAVDTSRFDRYWTSIYEFHDVSGMGFLGFDAFIDLGSGGEPFKASQGIFHVDGTTRDPWACSALRQAAILDGWLKPSQLNTNIQQKGNSVDRGRDGGYALGGPFNWYKIDSLDATVSPSANATFWAASKTVSLAAAATSAASFNYQPYSDYPGVYGPGIPSYSDVYNFSSIHASALLSAIQDWDTFALSKPLSATVGETWESDIHRDAECNRRIRFLTQMYTSLTFTSQVLIGGEVTGSIYDESVLPIDYQVDLSALQLPWMGVHSSAISPVSGWGGTAPACLSKVDAVEFPQGACLWNTKNVSDSGLDWHEYDLHMAAFASSMGACIDFLSGAPYNIPFHTGNP